MDQFDAFIKEIIEAKQLPGLTEDAKLGLVEEMRARLLDMIDRALIEALPDDKVEAFSALVDAEQTSDEQLQAFIADNGVNVEEVTTKVLVAFRDLYLNPSTAQDGA